MFMYSEQNKRTTERQRKSIVLLAILKRYIVVQLEKMWHCMCRTDRRCCMCVYNVHVYSQCVSYVLSLLLGFPLLFQKRDAYECVARHKFSTLTFRLYMYGLAMHITRFNSVVYMFYQRESNQKCCNKPEISVLVLDSTIQLNLCLYRNKPYTYTQTYNIYEMNKSQQYFTCLFL